jgi:hypothetical protein
MMGGDAPFLSSMVVDQKGDPIQGAIVRLVDASDVVLDSVQTDSAGSFRMHLRKVDKGNTCHLMVVKPLLSENLIEPVYLDRKPPIPPRIQLDLGAAIKGVIHNDADEPIHWAIVELLFDGEVWDEVETGPDGSFSIGLLEPRDDYQLRIKHYNYIPTETEPFELVRGIVGQVTEGNWVFGDGIDGGGAYWSGSEGLITIKRLEEGYRLDYDRVEWYVIRVRAL